MKKPNRTARGKPIDMDSIIKQNENTIAVGNTKTNARGDVLDKNNQVLIPVEKISRKQANNSEPTETVKMSDTDKITKKTKRTKPKSKQKEIVEKRQKQDENGNNIEEIEYDDGSIEVKNIDKEGDDKDDNGQQEDN